MIRLRLRPIDNLLLNMSGGLQIEHLTKKEIRLLVRHYGKNWKLKLGFQDNLEYLEDVAMRDTNNPGK